MTKILFKRGTIENIDNVSLEKGEPFLAYNSDKAEFYVGDGNGGKVLINLMSVADKAKLDGITEEDILNWNDTCEVLSKHLIGVTFNPISSAHGFANLVEVTEQVAANRDNITANTEQIAANTCRIDAMPLEVVDDNHIGIIDDDSEVMLPGKILQLNNGDDFSVSAELRIRYESGYENPYPDAIHAEFSTYLNTTDIYWTEVSAGQTGANFGGDAYYYNFDTAITESGIMYFKTVTIAEGGADIVNGTIEVLAVVTPTATTTAYIRTAETEDWTRLITEGELNAIKSDMAALQQQISKLTAVVDGGEF